VGQLKQTLKRVLSKTPPAIGQALPARAAAKLWRFQDASLASYPRDFVATTRYGFAFSGSTGDVIQRMVYVYGVWEPEISAWASGHLRPGDVAVDVGANTGYFSLLCSVAVGESGIVHSFEPVPSINAHLVKNLSINSANNVFAHHVALAEVAGETEIFRASAENIGNSATEQEPGSTTEGFVEKVRGDDLLLDVAPRIRLLKIDTEGDELRVLRGMPRTLSMMPTGSAVLVEISPDKLALRGHSADDVIATIGDGWEPYRLRNDYDFTRYGAKSADPKLVSLINVPTSLTDTVFIKRAN